MEDVEKFLIGSGERGFADVVDHRVQAFLQEIAVAGMIGIVFETVFVTDDFVQRSFQLRIGIVADVFDKALYGGSRDETLFGDLVDADIFELPQVREKIAGDHKVRVVFVIAVEMRQQGSQQIEAGDPVIDKMIFFHLLKWYHPGLLVSKPDTKVDIWYQKLEP